MLVILIPLIFSCKKQPKQDSNINSKKTDKPKTNEYNQVSYSHKDSLVLSSIEDSLASIIKKENLKIKYIHPYRKLKHTRDFSRGKFHVTVKTKVDKSDYIINLVENQNSKIAVVGYNHIYDFSIKPAFNKKELNFKIDKKRDLSYLFKKSPGWIESNLDVWSLITLKPKIGVTIFEYNVNPRYNYGSSFYFVFDSTGNIKKQGYNLSWGGGGADGSMHVRGDYLITCNEIYNIEEDTVLQYTKSPDISCRNFSKLSKEEKNKHYKKMRSTHAMRILNDSAFLVIFNRPGDILKKNGIIYSYKLEKLKKFKYYGLRSEMDAKLLVNEDYSKNKLVLHDYERGTLLFIQKSQPYSITEIDTSEMQELDREKISSMGELIIKGGFPEFEFRKNGEGNFFYYVREY
jgi:hypothetical protein